MGIPSYFAHVLKKYPRVIKRLSELQRIHNLYLDSNGMIYEVVRQMQYTPENKDSFEAELLQRICDSIDACVALLSPSDLVFIAFDGVAPVAKLNQQRERRYKSWYLGEMERQRRQDKGPNNGNKGNNGNKDNGNKGNKDKGNKGNKDKGNNKDAPKPAWNTSAITPGTNFMCALHAKLAQHYNPNTTATATATTTTTTPKIIVSSSNEPGEGEHKIFEYIREHASEHADKTSVIYGLDADLIMLCMSHLHISRNIYLYRETPAFAGSVHVALDEKEKYYMDIPEFADATGTWVPVNPPRATGTQVSAVDPMGVWGASVAPQDYIFMCFMLGNDFMPHFPALNIRTTGIATLMDAYRATFGPGETIIQLHTSISSPWSIHWPNYRRFVAHLAAQELTLIRKEHATRDRQARHLRDSDMEDDVMHDVLMLPMTQRDVERQINPFEPGWERRYYAALCDIHDDKAIASLCRNYLEGMEWTFRYYTTGCVDWKWTYANHYPPLLADLAKYMSDIPETQMNAFSFLSVKPKEPIRDVVQLCYVLPRASHALLPPAAERALMRSNLRSKYTDDGSPNFKWAYCKYFWECHTDLPELDLEELAQIVSI